MKRLLLIRHGKSDWEAGLSDKERPLNKKGRKDADQAGKIISKLLDIDLCFVSTAKRTTETYQLINAHLKQSDNSCIMCSELYLCSEETLLDTVHFAPDTSQTIALIGHNPGLAELASRMSKQTYIDMPTMAVYCCVFDVEQWENISVHNMISNTFINPITL